MNPQTHIRSLSSQGAECCGSKTARAGLDSTKNFCVAQKCGLQDHASFEAARQEAP